MCSTVPAAYRDLSPQGISAAQTGVQFQRIAAPEKSDALLVESGPEYGEKVIVRRQFFPEDAFEFVFRKGRPEAVIRVGFEKSAENAHFRKAPFPLLYNFIPSAYGRT